MSLSVSCLYFFASVCRLLLKLLVRGYLVSHSRERKGDIGAITSLCALIVKPLNQNIRDFKYTIRTRIFQSVSVCLAAVVSRSHSDLSRNVKGVFSSPEIWKYLRTNKEGMTRLQINKSSSGHKHSMYLHLKPFLLHMQNTFYENTRAGRCPHSHVWLRLNFLCDSCQIVLQSSCSLKKRIFFQVVERTLTSSPPSSRNCTSVSPSRPAGGRRRRGHTWNGLTIKITAVGGSNLQKFQIFSSQNAPRISAETCLLCETAIKSKLL